MSPLDDELRAALHGRAQVLVPSPDPLAGIERRAARLQRRRVGAAVAGSVLAVAVVAAAVPALQSTLATPRQDVPGYAATPAPTSGPRQVSYALDPGAPWGYRGAPLEQLGTGSVETVEREYAARRGAASVRITPLFGQVYEPSQQFELVFLAEADGAYRWGVVAATEAGPEFLWDEDLPVPAVALAAALPGDVTARLLVVTSREASRIDYAADDAAGFAPMAALAEGVAVGPLEGDPARDAFRVTWPDDTWTTSAPDPPAQEQVDAPEAAVVPQGYGWDPSDPWPFRGRGERDGELADEDERLFTARHGAGWTAQPLYAADSDAGLRLLFVLHTKAGEEQLVSTTWQIGDAPAQYADQVVQAGQALVQHAFPTSLDDGDLLLVALASPRAGGIVLTGEGGDRPDGIGDPGVGLWAVGRGEEATVRLYTEGDGVEYLVEPARTT